MICPKTVPELIEAFGGPTKFATEVIGKIPSTASEMKRSGSIHVSYWPKIIAAAPSFGIRRVTPEALMWMHIPEDQRPPEWRPTEAEVRS